MAEKRTYAEGLGSEIRRLRKSRDWTQRDLCVAVGYSGDVMISKIERGDRIPSKEKFAAIAQVFGLSPKELEARGRKAARGPASDADPAEAGDGFTLPGMDSRPSVRSHAPAFVQATLLAKENQVRAAAVQTAAEELNSSAKAAAEKLQEVHKSVDKDLLLPFFEHAGRVKNPPTEKIQDELHVPETEVDARLAGILRGNQSVLRGQIVGLVGSVAAGAGVGAVSGGVAALVTYTAVASLASASTGTAIASLAGVAATNATLAALGGGSLMAGGMGIAGGTMVLAGIVMAPVAALVGAAFVYKGRQLREEQLELQRKIEEADDDLKHMRRSIYQFKQWAAQEGTALRFAVPRGEQALKDLKANLPPDPTTTVEWADLTQSAQESFKVLVNIVTIVLTVISLPILPVAVGVLSAQDDANRHAFNDFTLDAATNQLAQV